MDKKSPDAFRTISEVAEWLGVPTHVLRFWESRFSQVKPVKRAGGRRYYRPADMELLGGIRKLLHDDGMTIRGVQKLLREEGVKHVAAMSPALDDTSMVDVTPSNVVELRSKPATAPEPSEAPAPVEEAVVAEAEVEAETPAPAAAAPADPIPAPAAPSEPQSAPVTEPPLTTLPEPDPEPEVPPMVRPAAQATPEVTPDMAPPAPPVGDAAAPMQTGFDFGDTTPPDPSQDDVLESSDAVEFHAHGADFTPPPAMVEEAAPTDAPADPASEAEPTVEDYDDPTDLPRLGAQDLPLATRNQSVPAAESTQSPSAHLTEDVAAEIPVDPPADAPAPAEAPDDVAPAILATPVETPETPSESNAAPVIPTTDPAPLATDTPPSATPQEDTPLPPLTAQDPAPVETVADTPAQDPELDPGQPPVQDPPPEPVEAAELQEAPIAPDTASEPATTAPMTAPTAPQLEPVESPAPAAETAAEPLSETTPPTAPASVDISHIPADPAEEDISPAGPSLAARMRRLAARSPQGSPAQMRALGDRLQELSGRMKRDAPRRGMQ